MLGPGQASVAEPYPGLVTLADVRQAADRLRDVAVRTPLLTAAAAGEPTLWVKPENLQPVGAFKIRGAYNAVAKLPHAVRENGVVAYSSGNHAQGVAYAARLFGIPAWIVIEDHAPAVKVAATRALGATVVSVPAQERERVAEQLAARYHAAVIPSFDHLDVIAGQGTIGLEILEDCPRVRTVLIPVSGGGLASGVAATVKYLAPDTRIIIVEPELAADTRDSLHAGRLIRWPLRDRQRSIADGLGGQPSDLSFAHLQIFVDDVVTVSEGELRNAVAWLGRNLNLVAEPAGAATTAAFFAHRDVLGDGDVVAIVSGGNIDPRLHLDILADPETGDAS